MSNNGSAILSPQGLARMAAQVDRRQQQLAKEHRAKGRLFVGCAPTRELARRRMVLFREWDAIVAGYNAKHQDNLLRYLRDAYVERKGRYGGDEDLSSREMRFIAKVEEHRIEEEAERERQRDPRSK